MKEFIIGLFLLCLTLAFFSYDFQKSSADNIALQECYEIYQSDSVHALKLNKCTGDVWMLSRVTLFDGERNTGKFTFRWNPVTTSYDEAELSIPGVK